MKPEFERYKACELLIRYGSGWLTHAEFKIVMIIYDHIYAFKERRENECSPVSINRFLHGHPSFSLGCAMTKTHLYSTISALKRKNFIEELGGTEGMRIYSLKPILRRAAAANSGITSPDTPKEIIKPYRPKTIRSDADLKEYFEQFPYLRPSEKSAMPSAIAERSSAIAESVSAIAESEMPKKLKKITRIVRSKEMVSTRAPVIINSLKSDSKQSKGNEAKEAFSRPVKTGVLGKINSKIGDIQKNTRAAQNAKLAAGKVSALVDHWHRKLKEYFPEAHFATFTLGEQANFKRLVKERIGNVDPREFIEFVFSRWVEIKRNKFHWMQDAPNYPKLDFVYRRVQDFLDALSTVEAGETLVAKDRREERTRHVRPAFDRLTKVQRENESLRRQLARVQAAQRDDKLAADAAAIAASRAAHPGLSSAERHKIWRQQSLAKASGAGSPTTTKSTKIDLSYEPPEFE